MYVCVFVVSCRCSCGLWVLRCEGGSGFQAVSLGEGGGIYGGYVTTFRINQSNSPPQDQTNNLLWPSWILLNPNEDGDEHKITGNKRRWWLSEWPAGDVIMTTRQ